MKTIFFGTQPYDRESFDRINADYGIRIKYHRSHLNIDNVPLAQGADAVCIFVNDSADAPTVGELARMGVRLIALRCAGFNNVDLKAAAEHGITVVRVPAYSPYAVAEHAVALMLSLNRKVHRAYWRTRDGNFALHGLLGFDMHGKTAGIVGTGKIARALIRILRGFGMEVLGYDPCPDEAFARESGMTYVPLTELYRRSDIISLHCPLTDRTLHMIDAEAIGQMKDGVIIINTGRGQLIRTSDLIEGLKEKKIGAAGLDVYEEEADYFYQDTSDRIMDDDMLARLLSFNNVILTSHQGFFTREALDNIARTTLENIHPRRVPQRSEIQIKTDHTMKKIVLLRHGESAWNRENRFTGWTDVDLTDKGVEEALKAGELLKAEGFRFGKAYTSYLKRAVRTLNCVLDRLDQEWIPVEKNWRLNEKHYGVLQGLNKSETAARFGEEQVHIWRRSYDVAPDPLAEDDPRNPRFDPRYAGIPDEELPRTESLKQTIERALPYWQCVIFPELSVHDEILVVAHGNSLRGIIKHLKGISDAAISELNLPTAVPYVFEFDDKLRLVKDYFLGDPEQIRKLMEAVANQGKK